MAIYGIGARYGDIDVTQKYIVEGVVGTGWDNVDAPELHVFFKELQVGDIVYIKSANLDSPITVKGIGLIKDSEIVENELVAIGRNVSWLSYDEFKIERPKEKNNVRMNNVYQELHPDVQKAIIGRLRD